MNTPTIIRTTSAQWLRRGIAITGALLISGAVALGLANRAAITVAPAAPAASVSAGQERFAALKQAQAEARDATYAPAPVQASGVARFTAMKERQAEARDPLANTLAMSRAVSGKDRFAAFKQAQAELRDATFVPMSAPASSGAERFAALKQRQLKQHDTTVVPVATQVSGRERFAALKQMQAELREAGVR
jgi:hypothetical protein